MTDRAQIITLEAFVASFLLLASLVVAMQITAVTPLSASTANEHVENQQGRLAAGVIDSAAVNDSIRSTVLYWNASNGTVYGITNRSAAPAHAPPTALGDMLERTLHNERYAYNLNVEYLTVDGEHRQETLVRKGTPSETVSAVTRTITLYDDDRLVTESGTVSNTTLADAESFYAPDVDPDGPLYNVVRVEVVLWRL